MSKLVLLLFWLCFLSICRSRFFSSAAIWSSHCRHKWMSSSSSWSSVRRCNCSRCSPIKWSRTVLLEVHPVGLSARACWVQRANGQYEYFIPLRLCHHFRCRHRLLVYQRAQGPSTSWILQVEIPWTVGLCWNDQRVWAAASLYNVLQWDPQHALPLGRSRSEIVIISCNLCWVVGIHWIILKIFWSPAFNFIALFI